LRQGVRRGQILAGGQGGRKPLVGAASIVLGVALAAAAYAVTGSTLASCVLASLATYIAPAYYAFRLKPWKSAAAAVLSSMLSGALAWSGVFLASEGSPAGFGGVPLLAAYLGGLLSAGLVSHVASSMLWARVIYEASVGGVVDVSSIVGALSLGLATSLGLLVFKARGDPRILATPSLLVIGGASLVFLVLALAYGSGGL